MKQIVKETREREIEVAFVKVSVPVRYDEEDIPNDFPLRKGDVWEAIINADTGEIQGWPQHPACLLHMKVVDEGSYYLLDENKNQIAALVQEYVPHGIIPGEYGDYIVFEISETGRITNWKTRPDVTAFFEAA